MNEIIHLLNQYGYIVLFISLMLELIIIPVPNEALMSYVGVLCFNGKMNIYLSIVSAGLGGILGATISYWIGRKLGVPFFRKYGQYIHMGPEKMEKMSKWYEKYGKVLLVFSYFIPGVRHVASIISGVIKLPFRSFSIFSYIGVFLWVSAFISLGNVLGPKWDQYQGEIKKWLVMACIVIGFFAIIYFVIRANKDFIKESLLLLNEWAFKRFSSFLKIKFIILIIFILFVCFFTLMVGMIEDFISNEFGHFDIITKTIVFSLINGKWQWLMNNIDFLSSWAALGLITLVTIAVIFINKTNKWLELIFFVSTILGSSLFFIGIRWLFHYLLNKTSISPDFPDEQTMLVMSVYGFFLIMFIRHKRNYFLSVFVIVLFLLLILAYFISGIYLHHHKPSDLVAGYVFSSAWLTGMTFSMEMFRLLSLIKEEKALKKTD